MKHRVAIAGFTLVAAASFACAQDRSRQLPDRPGKDTYVKVCGGCHGWEIVLGKGMTHEQWGAMVAGMVARGAKASEAELNEVVDYLAKSFPPGGARPGGPPRKRGLGAGPDDAHVVDPGGAARGRTVYIAECITCHGNKARGAGPNVAASQRGPDLVRSLVVLHDRYGSTIAPFLKAGHKMQSGSSSASLTTGQMQDLAHFLHEKVNDTLRSGPYSKILNVLTGDAAAGKAYFNGEGRCSSCHSPTGDLAGIASRYDPPALQSKFLFPRTLSFGRPGGGEARSPKPVMVTVTPVPGPAVSGVLVRMDDFNVSLRDSAGEYHSFTRAPGVKVEKHDPLAAHIELLDHYTDKNMHDIVAYLETLK
jgi:mono/diheme cytochrome c family protein